MDKEYPDWKRNLWAGLRAFTSGFMSSVGVLLMVTEPSSFTSLKNLQNWLIPIVIGGLASGFVMLGKFLRDAFPDNKAINKIPV